MECRCDKDESSAAVPAASWPEAGTTARDKAGMRDVDALELRREEDHLAAWIDGELPQRGSQRPVRPREQRCAVRRKLHFVAAALVVDLGAVRRRDGFPASAGGPGRSW
jgi:hypothetical protein